MPIVRTYVERLAQLTGVNDIEKLREILFNLKCESEVEEDGRIAIEVQSDRIDMFSVEGIAYAIKLYLGIEKQRVLTPKVVFKVHAEPPMKRPYIVVAAVKGINMDEDVLKELIEFQERLHVTYGRNRRKIAIGLHDLAKLPSYNITYREVNIYSAFMIPLFGNKKVSVKEVLELTDQGKIYGWISLNNDMHPAIFAGDEIISLPPVINSDITRLEPSTKDIFIDVTGTDFNAVMNVLNTIVHALSFYGGEILGAEVVYPNEIIVTPNLSPKVMSIDTDFASKWLGVPKDTLIAEAPKVLQRMGYIVEVANMERIVVKIPPYRCDILHQVDLVEDIAIGIGYDNLGLELIEPVVKSRIGKYNEDVLGEAIREVLIGLGYTEVNTLTLASSEVLNLVNDEQFPLITNALSKELNALRNSLIPSMLMVFKDSQYALLPVKVFEVGEVVRRCDECYNNWRNSLRAAFGIMDSEIRFEEIHADLYTVLMEIGVGSYIKLEPCKKKAFIDGRCGYIKYEDKVLGLIGEVHPEVLKSLGLEYPIAVAELYIDELTKIVYKRCLNC